MRRLGQIGVLCVLAASAGAWAEDGWIARIGFETGGDTLFTARTVGGDEVKLDGGGLYHIELGARRSFFGDPMRWESDLTAGYKADSDERDNGDMSFTRFTLNAVQYYRYSEKIRIGGGLTYHLNAELDVDVPGTRGKSDADNVLGFMVAADYRVRENIEIGLRATRIDYEFDDARVGEKSGNGAGLYVGLRF